MSEITLKQKSTMFKVAYGLLLLIVVGNVPGHLFILFFDVDLVLVSIAAVSFLTATILAFPYRRGERWAWFAGDIIKSCGLARNKKAAYSQGYVHP